MSMTIPKEKDYVGDCPYCNTKKIGFSVRKTWPKNGANQDNVLWHMYVMTCNECGETVVDVEKVKIVGGGMLGDSWHEPEFRRTVYPEFPSRKYTSPNSAIPEGIYSTYIEGVKVANISPRLALAIWRVCLEKILGTLGYKEGKLATRIRTLKNDSQQNIPSYLVDALDMIKDAGNIASHNAVDLLGNNIHVGHDEVDIIQDVIEKLMYECFEVKEKQKRIADSLSERVKNWTQNG